ncbi:hypothetical protein HPC49_03600 [Pyxidicoccus fallax]|uniref:Uncharacterized protein n=1 Tax=Pyxidicoccus fallax TaxID=394095 RepID=A0A848LQS7_9BACT|nr:hypothetical protein [Pyxidicoccus fallax]NMO19824.1 hypothetical protein [Pyxidicoccus fallax]NPC77341.1 hypothetical protein [Pyxidicoccus fallax]
MSDDDEDSKVRLEFGLPADASGYQRHECPSCMLEFKVKGNEARFNDTVAWWTSRAIAESGLVETQSESSSSSQMTCPYCAKPADAQSFLYGEYRSYVYRIAQREIVEPMVFGMLSNLNRTVSRRHRGMVSLRIETASETRSPRPIAGPDPDDMVRISCASCDEHFKISEGWSGAIRCPSCASELQIS